MITLFQILGVGPAVRGMGMGCSTGHPSCLVDSCEETDQGLPCDRKKRTDMETDRQADGKRRAPR